MTRMRSSPVSGRWMIAVRRALPWLVGAAVLGFRGRALELVAPSPCPGLLELTAIGAAALWPGATLGSLLGVLQAAAVLAGGAAIVALALEATDSLAVAAATGMAVGLGPLFPFAFAPPWEAASFAVCALVGALVWRGLDRRAPRGPALVLSMGGALLLAALIVPAWTILAAAGAGLTAYVASPRLGRVSRAGLGIACAAVLGIVVLGVLGLSGPDALTRSAAPSSLASCLQLRPASGLVSSRAADLARTLGGLLGPLALALAALGAFVQARRADRRRAALLAVACVSLVPAVLGAGGPRVLMAPLLVAAWLLAAAGLRETMTIAGGRAWPRVAAAGLLILVPALQVARRQAQTPDGLVRPNGHQQATLGQMRAVLNVVPSRTAFVEEDSSFDVLWRAAVFGGRRAAKPFFVVPRDREAVRQALGEGPVYAFPRGQQDLANRGFVVQPGSVRPPPDRGPQDVIRGFGAVTGVRPCHRLSRAWAEVDDSLADGRIALVADSEPARGPVTLYVGGARAGRPRPDGWPPSARRGFHAAAYDQRTGVRSSPLARGAADAGLDEGAPVLAAPFVVRLELWRTPGAPLALPVVLGDSFTAGVARLEGDEPVGTLMLCDAPAVEVVPFGAKAADPPPTPSPAAAPSG